MAHYCKEHDTVFFKKGKMKGYAHPIVDDEGENTGEWCNEEEVEETKEPKKEPKGESKTTESPLRQASIEAQNAFTGVVNLMVCGIIKKEDALAQTALNYASSKLSHWASQGEPGEPAVAAEPMATEKQLKMIYAVSKEKGYTPELALAIMTREFGVSSSKALTKSQASEFIELMNKGEFLDIEPEDLPF